LANKLDNLDLKIISELQVDGRIPISELAEKANSSRLTVSKRLKRLIDEGLIGVAGGLNLSKLRCKVANVGLEVKNEQTRRELETHLKGCPRVMTIFRSPEKANIHFTMWGENEQTINSTIESFRDLQNVDIIYSHYLGTPIHGEIRVKVPLVRNTETPCGMKCADCYRYKNSWCLGCPASDDYRDPFNTNGGNKLFRQ